MVLFIRHFPDANDQREFSRELESLMGIYSFSRQNFKADKRYLLMMNLTHEEVGLIRLGDGNPQYTQDPAIHSNFQDDRYLGLEIFPRESSTSIISTYLRNNSFEEVDVELQEKASARFTLQ